MGQFDSVVEAFVGFGYEVRLQDIREHLPDLVKTWKSPDFSPSTSSAVPSLAMICIETLLAHPEIMKEHRESIEHMVELEPFQKMLMSGDYHAMLEWEEEKVENNSKAGPSAKRAKVSWYFFSRGN